jgi:hypothetical protein
MFGVTPAKPKGRSTQETNTNPTTPTHIVEKSPPETLSLFSSEPSSRPTVPPLETLQRPVEVSSNLYSQPQRKHLTRLQRVRLSKRATQTSSPSQRENFVSRLSQATIPSPVPPPITREEKALPSMSTRRRVGSVFLGVALRTLVETGKATILCRMVIGASPAVQFFELQSTKELVEAIIEEELAVVAVAAPLWLPGEGLSEITAREVEDPEMWVARPWTRSTFVAALGFARVELEGSAPGLAARGRFLRESLAKHGILPSMVPASPEDDAPRLIEVHTGLSLKALRGTDRRQENIPDGRRVRRVVEAEVGEVQLPQHPDQRHLDALTAAWTALKFSQGAAWCPQGSSVHSGFVVIPFLA